MYEPYGEEKKGFNIKKKLAALKEKIQEKFKKTDTSSAEATNFKFDKITVTLIALGLLFVVGGISGYISYTSKVTDLQSSNMVLQKENDACRVELNDANQKMSACLVDIEDIKSNLAKMTLDYQTTKTDLQTCSDEKLTLSSDLDLLSSNLKNLQKDYDNLNSDYNKLKDDLGDVSCNYAKGTCGSGGMSYYYLDDSGKIVCCLNKDTCAKDPDGKEVKEINC